MPSRLCCNVDSKSKTRAFILCERYFLSYFIEVLNADQPGQGKTLGFIAQEIGREINTMGSKSNQAEMQQLVVKMKDELEQIKEQVLNIL